MFKKIIALFFCFLFICFPFSLNTGAEECNHLYGSWGVRVEATCTREGYKIEFCIYCDHENKIITGPALGHKEVIDDGVPATCETTGITEGKHCSVCSEVLVAQQIIEATGHNWDEGIITLQPTCVNSGIITYTCANNSSHTKTEEIAPLGHTPGAAATCTETQKCIVCKEVLKFALGHDYKSVVTPPTCTEKGYTTYTCLVCNDFYTENIVSPLGHSFGDWKVSVDATCTKSGLEICFCEMCDEIKTRETEKTAHTFLNGRCSGCKRLLGDGNINDELDIVDLIILKNTLVNAPVIYDPFLDMDIDGVLNANDLIILKKILFENF